MPNLLQAQALERRRIRVTFDGALSDTTTGTHGAGNPANWSIRGDNTTDPSMPVAAADVSAVTVISTTALDLLLVDDLTPGGLYIVSGLGEADNGITGVPLAPNNTASAAGVVPPAPTARAFDLLTMFPSKLLDEDAGGPLTKLLRVFGELVQLHLDRIDRFTDILDFELAPDGFLDLILRDLGDPFAFDLTTTDKRRLAGALLTMYREKGTAPGLSEACRFFLTYQVDLLWGGLAGTDWSLGDHLLGVGSVIGTASYVPSLHGADLGVLFSGTTTPFDFVVKVGKGSALTADETTRVAAIVAFMRPGHTIVKGTLVGLPPPATLTATPGIGRIVLSWPGVPGAVGYTVFEGHTPLVSALSPTATIASGAGYTAIVPSGQQRYYVVAARDGSGINGVASPLAWATAL